MSSSSSFFASNRLTTISTPPPPHRRNSHHISRPSSVKCQLSSSDDNNNNNNDSSSLFKKTLTATVAISSVASALFLTDSLPDFNFSGGGGGGGGGGSSSGGGGGGWFNNNGGEGGDFWSRILSPATAFADEPKSQDWDSHELPANITVLPNKLSGFKKYKISDIIFLDRNTKTKIGTEDSFLDMVSLKPGGVYTRAQLQKELESLATCGMFEKVDMEGKTNADGTLALTISFAESMWEKADRFRCINVGLMGQSKPVEMDPDMSEKEKMEFFRRQEREYKRRIDTSRPCLLAPEVYKEIKGMLSKQGRVSARLLQKIRDRVQKWYHDEGYACAQVVNFGNLNTREVVCEVVEGDITQLNIQFLDKLGNVVEGNTENPVVQRELPKQASLQPGGTITFEHRNLQGLNRSLTGSVTTSNFLNPQDDLAFKMEYAHPYLDGVNDPRNRTLRVSCFNSRKLSPVFTGGPGVDEVPSIWVDRAGVKANITENFSRQSKFTYGLVMEEIITRDETNHICSNGQRVLPNGGISADGPPTTLSGTGIDKMAFLQANITRDNTRFVNGAIVGSRNMFQVMSDAPAHHLFVILGPVDESKNQLPDILCVIQGFTAPF